MLSAPSSLAEELIEHLSKGGVTYMITIEEASKILGISRSSAYAMAADGSLPTCCIYGTIRRVPLGLLLETIATLEKGARRRT